MVKPLSASTLRLRRGQLPRLRTLLCLSSRGCGRSVELAVDTAGEVALKASADLFGAASFGGAALNVGAGIWVAAHAGDDSHVQGAVQSSVSAAVESVSCGVS